MQEKVVQQAHEAQQPVPQSNELQKHNAERTHCRCWSSSLPQEQTERKSVGAAVPLLGLARTSWAGRVALRSIGLGNRSPLSRLRAPNPN